MKIDSLILENFGIYGMKQFSLASDSLVLIYGSNEAGKTTALNGLRQALFGFPVKSPYLTGKTMSSNVRAILRDGQRIEFSRRKKQVDAYSGKRNGQTPLSAEELSSILGNFDLKAYESLFGFSLDELRKGNEALKHSKLADALAGGGLGGLDRLVWVQRNISDFLSETLKKSGGSGRINAKLAEIRDVQKRLESVEVSPAILESLRLRMDDAERRSRSLTSQLEQLRSELSTCESLAGALPMLAELSSIERLLLAKPVPAVIDIAFCHQWMDLKEKREKLAAQLESETKSLEENQLEQSRMNGSSQWLDQEKEIESLGFQAGEIAALRRAEVSWQSSKSEAENELSRLESELCHELAEAHDSSGVSVPPVRSESATSLAKILDFQLTASHRQQLDRILNRFAVNEKQHETLKLSSAAAQQLRTKLGQPSTSTILPENLDELERCTGEIELAARDLERMQDAEAIEKNQKSLQDIAERLALRLGAPGLDIGWKPLAGEEIEQYVVRFSEADRELAKLRREQERINNELVRTIADLNQHSGQSSTLPLDELRSVWSRRDLRLTSWRDDLLMPLLAATITKDEQLARLAELQELAVQNDILISHLLEAADVLATLNEKKRLVKQLEIEQKRVNSTVEKLQRRQSELASTWQALWAPILHPLPPEQMLVWSQEFRAWKSKQEKLILAKQEIAEKQSFLEESLRSLQLRWPAELVPFPPIDSLSYQIHRWRSQASQQQQLAQQANTLQSEISQLELELGQCQSESNTCREQFSNWLSTTHYPPHWKLENMPVVLGILDRARQSYAALGRADRWLQESHIQIQRFEQQVIGLAQRLALDLERHVSAELHVGDWLQRLRLTRQEHARRSQLIDAQTNQKQVVAGLLGKLQACDAAIDHMVTACQAEGRSQIDHWLEQADQNSELHQRKCQLEVGLQAVARDQSLESLKQTLTQHDAATLLLRKNDLQQMIRQVDQQRAEAEQEIGALDNELRQRQCGDEALRLAHFLQRLRGELSELSEQWIIHKLADQLLARTIDRFSREHEPELMRQLRRHLTKLTGGRYTRVEQIPGKNGGFLVRDVDGVATEPDKLSTGAREQLYLAIRLAFIDHYCAHHEPLPVIMDDCFVNFDDQRARFAVEALLNWDTDIQTILLSCHGRMLQILADLAPQATVISLDHDQITTARALMDQQLIAL